MPRTQFVSEPIVPEAGSFAPGLMTQGLAGLPAAFTWRGRRYGIVACIRHVKQSAREGHTATGERYLRRQEFEVRLDSGQTAVLYVERQARRGAGRASARRRWFLYSVTLLEEEDGPPTSDDCPTEPGGVP